MGSDERSSSRRSGPSSRSSTDASSHNSHHRPKQLKRHNSTRREKGGRNESSDKKREILRRNKSDHDINLVGEGADDFDTKEASDWFSFDDGPTSGGPTTTSNHSFDTFDTTTSSNFHSGDGVDDDGETASFHGDEEEDEENEEQPSQQPRRSHNRRGGHNKRRSSSSVDSSDEDFASISERSGGSRDSGDPLGNSERSSGRGRRPPPRTRSGPRGQRGLPSRTNSLSGGSGSGTLGMMAIQRQESFSKRRGVRPNPPTRSRSDAGMVIGSSRRRLSTLNLSEHGGGGGVGDTSNHSAEETKRLQRYNSMRAMYRNTNTGGNGATSSGASVGDTSMFDASSHDGGGGGPGPGRERPSRRASLLDGAPNMLLPQEHQQISSRSGHGNENNEDANEGEEGGNNHLVVDGKKSERWLSRRADKQRDIMCLTQEMKDRFAEERLEQERLHQLQHGDEEGGSSERGWGDDDDDQPMAMRSKKTAMEQLFSAVKKTGGVTKSAAKGSVNAVRDPKRAANRLGHLSKDVAKGTMNVVLDPTKAAKKTGKLAKNVTVGSAKVGFGITKGVTKGTLGASKAVAKGSLKATTSTVKMSGKAVKKTARAVTGSNKHKSKKSGTEDLYDASQLEDRKDTSFLDRISQMVQEEDHELEGGDVQVQAAAAAAIAANRPNSKAGGSILVPIASNNAGRGSWDV